MIFNVEFSKYSTAGNKKLTNEDAVGYYLPQKSEDLYLRGQMFLVADGMGEKQDGEFASKLVIQTIIQEYFETPWSENLKGMLTNALNKANSVLYQANIDKGKRDYYSNSLICAVVHENTLYLASVGDCSAYLFSNNSLVRLVYFEKRESEATYPLPNIQGQEVSQHLLGVKENIEVEITQRQIQINDYALLFTNSIIDSIPEQDLPRIIGTSSLSQACELVVKMAIDKNIEDDATAIIIKVKGIKRLSIEQDKEPIERLYEPGEPEKRQIVIKGVRYRSNHKDSQISEPDQQGVNNFSQDRDFRRPVHKRTMPVIKSSKFSMGKVINIAIIFLIIFLVIFAAIKYIPEYLDLLKESPSVQIISAQDSLNYSDSLSQQPIEQLEDSIIIPIEEPLPKLKKDTTITKVQKEIEVPVQVPLNVALVDGSKKSISLNDLTNEVKGIYSKDRLIQVKSSYRIKSSLIIWRRTFDSLKSGEIAERVEYLKKLFSRYFKIEPEITPMDFTFVIGADFKMPKIQDKYSRVSDAESDFYVEILNGFKVAGSARKLGNQLHNQRYNEKKIVIVNYRNADKLNYLHSFLKCDASMTDIAEKFVNHFKLTKSVTNAPLFDIKILIGSDIQF